MKEKFKHFLIIATLTLATFIVRLGVLVLVKSPFYGFGVDAPAWVLHARQFLQGGVFNLQSFCSIAEMILSLLIQVLDPIFAVNLLIILFASLLGIPLYLLTWTITNNRVFASSVFLFVDLGIPEVSHMIAYSSLNRFYGLFAFFFVVYFGFKIHHQIVVKGKNSQKVLDIVPYNSLLLGGSLFCLYLSHIFLLAHFIFASSIYFLLVLLVSLLTKAKSQIALLKTVLIGFLISIPPILPFIPLYIGSLQELAFFSSTSTYIIAGRSLGEMCVLTYNSLKQAFREVLWVFILLFTTGIFLTIKNIYKDKSKQETNPFPSFLALSLYLSIIPSFYLIWKANYSPMYVVIAAIIPTVTLLPYSLKTYTSLLVFLTKKLSTFYKSKTNHHMSRFPLSIDNLQKILTLFIPLLLLLPSIFVSLTDYPQSLQYHTRITKEERDVFKWIQTHTKSNDSFVCNRKFRRWVEAITDRPSYYPTEPVWYLRHDGATKKERRTGLLLSMALSGSYSIENRMLAISEAVKTPSLRPLISLNTGEFYELININDSCNKVYTTNIPQPTTFTDLSYHYNGTTQNTTTTTLHSLYTSPSLTIHKAMSLSKGTSALNLQYVFQAKDETSFENITVSFHSTPYSKFESKINKKRSGKETSLSSQFVHFLNKFGKDITNTIKIQTDSSTSTESYLRFTSNKTLRYSLTASQFTSAKISIKLSIENLLTINEPPKLHISKHIFNQYNISYILINSRKKGYYQIYKHYLQTDPLFHRVKQWPHNTIYTLHR